jgi:hypothetical protein
MVKAASSTKQRMKVWTAEDEMRMDSEYRLNVGAESSWEEELKVHELSY